MDSFASDSSDSSDSSESSSDNDSEEEEMFLEKTPKTGKQLITIVEEKPFAERTPVRSIFVRMIYHARFVQKRDVSQLVPG